MNNQQGANNNKQQTTNNQQQTTNNKQQTTNNKQQTTNNKQPTTNNQQLVIQIEQKTERTKDGKIAIVLLPTGRLDITTAPQFRLKLQDCITQLSPHIVVNLANIDFIDSSGLTTLVAGMRDATDGKGSFRICSIHQQAKLVFEVTMMDSVFEIFDTEAEALEARRTLAR